MKLIPTTSLVTLQKRTANARLTGWAESLRNGWMAVWAACWTHWKTTTSTLWSLSFLISSVPIVAVWGWIAIQTPDRSVLSYLMVGAPLMAIWHSVFYGIVGSLRGEINYRTIEFNMISRTSVLTVLFGRAMAMMTFGVPAGIVAVATMLIVARQAPEIASYPWLFSSIVFVFLGLTVTGMFLAPISALTNRYHGGMFSPLIPIITVLCGFVFPVSELPAGLAVLAHFLPSTWAMESALQAIRGPESTWAVLSGWLICLAVGAGMLVVTFFLYKMVEKRLRITGLIS
jgi:ABC-2 type transport system permease protein